MWANAVLLAVPYLGAYPSIPTISIAWLVTGSFTSGAELFIILIVTNTLFYPLLGSNVVRLRNWPAPQKLIHVL